MVTSSGFTHTPATRAILALLVTTSIGASVLSLKHYLPLKPTPHLWPYLQVWRILTFQLAYTSSTELLFAAAVLYQLRVLERIWGSRKFASFLIASYGLCMTGTVTTGLLLKIASLGWWSYIPSGTTAVLVSLIAVWRKEVPRLGGFKVLLEDDPAKVQNGTAKGLEFTDKWTVYLITAQLAMSQFPFGLLPAVVGWVVGSAWVEELVPSSIVRWRVPGWIVGEDSTGKRGRQYEGLRRRLEEENQDGMREVTEGMARGDQQQQQQQSSFVGGLGRYFTSS